MKSGPGLHRDRGHATRFRQPRGEGTAAAAPFAVAPGLELAAHTGIMANEPDHRQ